MAAATVNTRYLRHWTVGDVQVTRIVEIFPFQVPAADLFAGGTPELIPRYPWLLPAGTHRAGH
jgi:hypothetical protein